MKNFAIGVLLRAVDQISGPLRGATGNLSKFQQQTANLAARGSGGLRAFGSAALPVIKGFGVAALGAGTAVLGLANKIRDIGDEIGDTAGYLGISTKALQEYRFVAERSGLSTSDMDAAIAKLTVNLGKGGSALEETLGKMGLSVEQLRAAGPEKVIEMVAQGMTKIEDPTQRSAAAVEIFGKSGFKLMGVMNQGAQGVMNLREEAFKLGAVLDEEAIAKASEFDDALINMKYATQGLAGSLGATLLPAVTDATKGVTEFVQKNRVMFSGMAKSVMGAIKPLAAPLGKIFQSAFKLIGKLAPALEKIFTALVPIIEPILDLLDALLDPIGEIVDALAGALAPTLKMLQPVIVAVTNLIRMMVNILTPLIKAVMWLVGAITSYLTPAFDFFYGILNKVYNVIADMVANPMQALGIMASAIKDAWQPLAEFFDSLFGSIEESISWFVQGPLGDFIKTMGGAMDSVASFMGLKSSAPATPQGAAMIPQGVRPGAPPMSPSSNSTGSGNGGQKKTEVVVDFRNLPRGVRVDGNNVGRGLNMNMGYANVGF